MKAFEIVFTDETINWPRHPWPDETHYRPKQPWVKFKQPKPHRAPLMKIDMLLHFYCAWEPYAPEQQRRSPAYTQFVKELLREGLIVRPTTTQREEYPGWAYRTTEKGEAWVHAICTVPVPVARTRWIIPS
jgi:hypothetical protein